MVRKGEIMKLRNTVIRVSKFLEENYFKFEIIEGYSRQGNMIINLVCHCGIFYQRKANLIVISRTHSCSSCASVIRNQSKTTSYEDTIKECHLIHRK